MGKLLVLFSMLLLGACSGEAESPDEPEPGDGSEVFHPPPPPSGERAIPLCEGEDEPLPGECQRLVYLPASGYCNRWLTCPSAE